MIPLGVGPLLILAVLCAPVLVIAIGDTVRVLAGKGYRR